MQDAAMEARTLGGIEHVYREQAGRLWRSLLVFTGDPDVASDAVAEAFAQVIARGQRVLDPASWVWRVAYRIAAGEPPPPGAPPPHRGGARPPGGEGGERGGP